MIFDAALALLFTMISLAAATRSMTAGLLWMPGDLSVMLWTVALAVPIATRRKYPEPSALIFVLLVLLQLILGPTLLPVDVFSTMSLVYSVIAYGKPEHTKSFILLTFLMTFAATPTIIWSRVAGPMFPPKSTRTITGNLDCATAYSSGLTKACGSRLLHDSLERLSFTAVFLALAIVLGYWQRARRHTVTMLRERNRAIASRNEEEAHIARMAERARIARDMHDVVAHTLSTVIAQADGGRYAATHDLELARRTMNTIRLESRHALDDMKGLFGMFGQTEHHGYADIATLIGKPCDGANMSVSRRIVGEPNSNSLSVQADGVAYRVVQEALTNVRRHAGAHAHVNYIEQWTTDALEIELTDDGRGAASALDAHKSGYGLIGMRERLEAIGGKLSSGPRVGGGFTVRAVIPYAIREANEVRTDETSAQEGAIAHVDDAAKEAVGPAYGNHSKQGRDATDARSKQNRISDENGDVLAYPSSPHSHAAVTTATGASNQQNRASNNQNRRKWSGLMNRFSIWGQRHYLAVDATVASLILLIVTMKPSTGMLLTSVPETYLIGRPSLTPTESFLQSLPICFALALRRRCPRFSAGLAVTTVLIHMVFLDSIPSMDVLALVLLYSICLYSVRSARIWSSLAAFATCLLFSAKATTQSQGYGSMLDLLPNGRPRNTSRPALDSYGSLGLFLLIAAFSSAVTLVIIICAMMVKLNGNNAILLRARAEALTSERERQKVLAANLERSHISSEIQADVDRALGSVIKETEVGLELLKAIARSDGLQPSETDAERIAQSFASIARQGRQALSHIRSLLGVLRQTEESPSESHKEPRMHPVSR
ncbi:two-component system sensor kinase [Bifidobacterium bombi DSM 19703]|uniref:histidine kinase n=2 Tax=Bifidobacterium bombi TaxID=471511 RepID=A0A080N3Y3_9BIFI|nr:two-component system sensor kinase [Bifidobacterium bombi DSM 19703]